jgi:hypothetical protein
VFEVCGAKDDALSTGLDSLPIDFIVCHPSTSLMITKAYTAIFQTVIEIIRWLSYRHSRRLVRYLILYFFILIIASKRPLRKNIFNSFVQ